MQDSTNFHCHACCIQTKSSLYILLSPYCILNPMVLLHNGYVKHKADQTLSVGHPLNQPRKMFFFLFKFVLSRTTEEIRLLSFQSQTLRNYNFESTTKISVNSNTVEFLSSNMEDLNQATNLFTERLLYPQTTSSCIAKGLSSTHSDSLLPLKSHVCPSPPYSHGTVRRQRLSLMICWSSWSTEPFWNRRLRQ